MGMKNGNPEREHKHGGRGGGGRSESLVKNMAGHKPCVELKWGVPSLRA